MNEALSFLITLILIGFCLWLFKKVRRIILDEAASNEYVGPGPVVRTNGYDINHDWSNNPEDQ